MIFFFVIQFVDNFLEQATTHGPTLPDWLVDRHNFGQVKYIARRALLVLLVIFRPQGIFGDKREQAFDVR